MLLFFFVEIHSRDVREIEESVIAELRLVDEQLNQLRKLRQELNLARPSIEKESVNYERTSNLESLKLVSVDVSRTREELNAKLFAHEGSDPSILTFIISGSAPIITFKSEFPLTARRLRIRSTTGLQCSVRQFRLHFLYDSEFTFTSRVIELPNKAQINEFDLEVDLIYDTVKVDVLRNWGDECKTCLNYFELYPV
jgi:hypothetical protein